MLFKELGFERVPVFTVVKLGLPKQRPDLSWREIFRIAQDYYPEDDRSYIVFKNALNFDLESGV